MTTRNTANSYGSVTRTFHWLTALLIIAAFPLGVIANDMAYDTSEALALKAQLFSVHKTLGVAVFLVALLRILWALTETKPTALHPERKAESILAETVHWALYLSLVIVPLSGWIHHAAVDGFAPILWPFGQGLPFVPKSESVATAAGATHWLFTKVMFASVALHIAGALKHVFIDRDLTLARMTKGTPAGAGHAGHSALPLVAALAIFAAGAVGAWQIAAAKAPAPASQSASATETAPASATGGNWQVNAGTLGFTVRQMGADVAGTLPVWTADITFDEATGTGDVRVEIDLTQLTLGSVTDQAKGPEFFDVTTHPKAVFAGKIAPAGTDFEAIGTLSLRGAEVPMTLPFTLEVAGTTAKMSGNVTLDRRDFGMGKSYADETNVGFSVIVAAELTATRKD
jgi:cytochrome b561/polyisoprenoid-binding protein YceI